MVDQTRLGRWKCRVNHVKHNCKGLNCESPRRVQSKINAKETEAKILYLLFNTYIHYLITYLNITGLLNDGSTVVCSDFAYIGYICLNLTMSCAFSEERYINHSKPSDKAFPNSRLGCYLHQHENLYPSIYRKICRDSCICAEPFHWFRVSHLRLQRHLASGEVMAERKPRGIKQNKTSWLFVDKK